MERCDACGYEYNDLARRVLGSALVDATRSVAGSLTAADRMRERPAPEVWSALEYGCHVRDLLEVQNQRIHRALSEDNPDFEPMRRDERVTEMAYNDQDPGEVAADMEANARDLARTIAELDEHDWERTGMYNWPERKERTVDWIVRNTVHELVHHRRDIDSVSEGEIP